MSTKNKKALPKSPKVPKTSKASNAQALPKSTDKISATAPQSLATPSHKHATSGLIFDDMSRLPRQIGRVYLTSSTDLKASDYAQTLSGVALKRMVFDGRLDQKILFEVEVSQSNTSLRAHWQGLMANVYAKRQADGLVWMRSDVVLEEYLIIERLAEAWAMHMSIELRDAEGKLIFWALSAHGLALWMDALHGEQEKARALDAQEDSVNATKSNARKMPELPELTGAFGEAELAQAKHYGVVSTTWAMSLSIALAPQEMDLEKVILSEPKSQIATSPTAAAGVPPLLVVCASREHPDRFYTHTATGRSIARMKNAGFNIRVLANCDNQKGLGTVYNQAIKPEFANHTIVFMHDDVWVDDVHLAQHLHEALLRYDVVGVAGNRNRQLSQPAWSFPQKRGEWDHKENLVGVVAHDIKEPRKGAPRNSVSVYGTTRGPARLMDGVLLAARGRSLLQANVRFDERFEFHFYDMDFCRTAEKQGLRLGVWPLAISHCSGGNFGSFDWFVGCGRYIGKWTT